MDWTTQPPNKIAANPSARNCEFFFIKVECMNRQKRPCIETSGLPIDVSNANRERDPKRRRDGQAVLHFHCPSCPASIQPRLVSAAARLGQTDMLNQNILLYGREELPPKPLALKAGPLSMI